MRRQCPGSVEHGEIQHDRRRLDHFVHIDASRRVNGTGEVVDADAEPVETHRRQPVGPVFGEKAGRLLSQVGGLEESQFPEVFVAAVPGSDYRPRCLGQCPVCGQWCAECAGGARPHSSLIDNLAVDTWSFLLMQNGQR